MTKRLSQSGIRTALLLALLSPLLALTAPAPALAATECRGVIANQTIRDNLVVPEGASCALIEGTTVTGNVTVRKGADVHGDRSSIGGNVTVGAGARFFVESVTIGGNVRGDGFSGVSILKDTVVNGNVTLKGGKTWVVIYDVVTIHGSVAITANTVDTLEVWIAERIGGDLTVNDNRVSGPIVIDANRSIGGNVRVDNNIAAGEISIQGNTIGGSLRCSGNNPAPVVFGNTVGGRARGQCADA